MERTIKRGDIFYADLNPVIGSEQGGTRPVLVISNDIGNRHSPTPSLAQAIKMKKYNQDGKLTSEVIQSIMEEEKPNQKEKPAFRDERITKLIPKTVPRGQETDFVVKALEFYNRHLQRNKAHER